MAERNEVLNILQHYIRDVKLKMPIDKVFLYGSYAKGTETEYSDVDVCFFSDYFENKKRVELLKNLILLGTPYYKDIYIEPNVFATSEIDTDNPFVKEILRNGIEIS